MMKNYILLLASFFVFGQKNNNSMNFTKVSHQENLSHLFKSYDIVHLTDNISNISEGESINLSYNGSYTFKIQENKILDNSYVCQIKTEEGIVEKTKSELNLAKFYWNDNIRAKNAFSFSVYDNHYSFYVLQNDKEFYIEPLSKFSKNAPNNLYVYYEVKNVINPENIGCGIDELKIEKPKPFTKTFERSNSTCKRLDIAMSIDYAFISLHGSIENAINRTLEVSNLSEINYKIANGLAYDVEFVITEHFVMSCGNGCALWDPTLEIYSTYSSFGTNASKMFTKPYDIKIHFMPLGGGGTAVGLGAFSMCGGAGIAVVKDYTTNTNWTRCIMSHEIGHNFNCVHNSEIMNATVSGSNIWNSASITTINNSLNTYACITECTTNSCENKKIIAPSIATSSPTDSATYSFTPETGVTYKARMYNFSTQTWTSLVDIPTGQNSITFGYVPVYCNDKLKIEVTPYCGTDEGSSTILITQTNEMVNAPVLNWSSTQPTEPQCAVRAKYYSVNAIDAGASPTYIWKLNGAVVGGNSNSLTLASNPANGDVITCTLISSASCVMNNTVTISRTLNVYPPTVLSVSIVASQNPICAGMPVTFTATGVNIEGQFPYYQWKKNGQSIQGQGGTGGSGGPTITVYPATDGEIYTCTLYDGQGCHEGEGADSNSITITIQNPCTLSNDNFVENQVSIYPNPTKDLLQIDIKQDITKVELYSLLGQKLKEYHSKEISIGEFAKGTYFAKIFTEDSVLVKKVVRE